MEHAYIASHINDESIAETIKKYLEDDDITCHFSYNDKSDDITASAMRCKVAIIIITKNSTTDSTFEDIIDKITGKGIYLLRYQQENLKINDDLLYFIKRIKYISADNNSNKNLKKLADITKSKLEKIPDAPIDRIKAVDKDYSSKNTRCIKPINKSFGKILLGLIFAQTLIFFIWLTSKYSMFFVLLIAAAILAYVYILRYHKKRCCYIKCRKKHNVKKVLISETQSNKSHIYNFCDKHFMKNDVSGKKVIFNPVYAAVIAVTIAFVLFMSLADVKAEDFTFLDIRQKIMSQISVKFKDEGFEAFVRSEFDLGDKKITRADLEDKTGLFFTREHQKEPIYSLDDIKYFPNLDFFYTGDRIDIAGNLDSFKYTPKIEFINVAKSNISGDIDVLASLESLSYFGCDWMEDDDVNRDRNIYGDIRVFKNLEKLKSIHLPDTDVYGDIQSLKGLDLEELVLAYTDVDGDISVCEEMKNLSQLNLDFSNISGDISSIKTLKELKYFTAASTLISGDIENLSELDLETLDLNETGVFGDISAFMDMKSMENLDVGGTDIKGDIVAFENMKNLWNILFWDTNIIGDISIFKDMTGLEFLGASQYVTGDISFLYDFEHLAQLETPMGSFFRDGAETDYTIEVDLNNIPNMVSSIVSDWQSLYGDVAINKEENSDIFISVSEEKEVGNGYSFTSINTPVDITLLTALDQDDGVNVKGNQAISMLFQTSTKNIYFSFLSKDSNQTIKVIFEEDGVSVLAPNADEQNIVTDEAFNFEESKLYVLFFAIDKNGLLKGVVWEFGKVEHIIYIDKDFAELEKAKEFQNQSWTFAIGTLEPSTMTIVYYTAYKFEQYAPS